MTPDERKEAAEAFCERTTWGEAIHRMVCILDKHGYPHAALYLLENYIEMVYAKRDIDRATFPQDDWDGIDSIYDDAIERLRNSLLAQIK